LGQPLEALDRDPVQGGIGERRGVIEPRLRDNERAHLGAELHRPGKVPSVEVCMRGPGRDLHLRSLRLAAQDRLDERLETQEEALDQGYALLLEEIDPLADLDAHHPPDLPELEAQPPSPPLPAPNHTLEPV